MRNKNYAGIPDEYAQLDTAEVVLIPVPYDGTSTWQKGADKGPDAFLHASENMELYDIETDSEVYQRGIYLANPVTESSSPNAMVEAVEKVTSGYLEQEKFVTLFGGEHSISIGAIRAFRERYSRLTVLQLDAHADLRMTYEGTRYNHACAMHEASRTCNLIQVGIRSMDSSELEYVNEDNMFYAHDLQGESDWHKQVLSRIEGAVYITIDLDAFDPSILAATGTPEPGGLLWYDTLDLLKKVFANYHVVGFDIVELCPNGVDKSSDFLAAKLYYKMLSYKFQH